MREWRQIVERWRRGEAVALATLVRVEGSSYRQAGARLLICRNGEYAGSISGGCLEAEVVRKAEWTVRHGAVVERFSTLFDDTAEIPYGLGCGGTVDLLLEPAGTPEFEALMAALEGALRGEVWRVTTQLPLSGRGMAREVRRGDRNELLPEEKGVFAEVLLPPQRLVVVGAGNDAQPVVQVAAMLGWSVTVVDGRASWARAERFPQADAVRVAAGPEGMAIGGEDAVVVMTHSYEQDRAWLAALLPLRPRYLGLLGARHRSALLVSEVAVMLGWSVERVCAGLFAPVGLDLGGDGAEAIALAVVAEVHAFCEGKVGASRRMTAELVAQQVAEGGASRYLQAQCAL
jgi:xanthine/CO dehydrogenase XdhC/CoxF family maturation factor